MIRFSDSYIPTLKEAPADAEVISHQLLVRAGFIRKLTSGVYIYLPLAVRSLDKISRIVREEMNASGAQEISMPMVQPADLWKESGRWEFYGKELLRLRDRHDRDFCLGPTHEEVVTNLIRGEVKSYRQLPFNLYQIQTKFRDEIRPRFGLMRGREFIMKDAYSFDRNEDGANKSYWIMFDAYVRIFSRFGLSFRSVEADSGAIGGSFSHEFMVLADTGEDTIVTCAACEFASNLERAAVSPPATASSSACPAMSEVLTPGCHTVEEVTAFLSVAPEKIIKTLIFDADGHMVVTMVRGDRSINEVKLKNLLGAISLTMATPEQVRQWTKGPVGFSGPVGLEAELIYADAELAAGSGYVVGANKKDAHIQNVDLTRDVGKVAYHDLRQVSADDSCPKCGGALHFPRGIEVGHVFKLGTKYSQAMNATFLDEDGQERVMIMGCYGIGVSRVLAACIEQNHDDKGIIFAPPIAPLDVSVICLDPEAPEVLARTEQVVATLEACGLEALLDDRAERPGVKFKDADLIGLPMQLIVGAKGLARGIIEAKDRRTGQRTELALDDFAAAFAAWRDLVLQGWKEKQEQNR